MGIEVAVAVAVLVAVGVAVEVRVIVGKGVGVFAGLEFKEQAAPAVKQTMSAIDNGKLIASRFRMRRGRNVIELSYRTGRRRGSRSHPVMGNRLSGELDSLPFVGERRRVRQVEL